MNRRAFVSTALAATAVGAASRGFSASPASGQRFHLGFAPHLGTFNALAGSDEIDQLKFMHDQGFWAFEDNRMMQRDIAMQEKIRATYERLGMTMGVFVAEANFKEVTFARRDRETTEGIVARMKEALVVAARVGTKWVTVVPGLFDLKLDLGYQTANVVDNLRRCAELCEAAGVVMVLEPLNRQTNHPGVFLHSIPQSYEICRAVNSRSCKILYDIYHIQISEGNLIPNFDLAWEEVAYVQVGDNPGRKEPGTGEINYANVFKHLQAKGYAGVIGMEHGASGKGAAGEQAVIAAYRAVDAG